MLLIWGADRFVHGAAATARNLGVAPLLIGLTIVAFATSAPEILVSVLASLRGQPGLAFGNAIGSNIVNIGLVLGCVAIIRPIQMRSATLRREMPALLAVTLLTVSLFLDAYLSRIDGLVMLTGLGIVLIWMTRIGIRSAPTDPIQSEYEAEIPKNVRMPMAIFWLAVGLAALLLGAHLLVKGSISVAEYFQVSDVVIGILLVALGTSLPELAVSLVSALRGEYGLAIGNIVGSNIFNLLGVVGVAATIAPIGAQEGRDHAAIAGLLLRFQHHRAGAIAEQHAGAAILPIHDPRKGFRADHQRALGLATDKKIVRRRQREDEA
jgi:cation:H+ antiporter